MRLIKRFLALSIICSVLLAPQIFAAYGGAPNSGSGNNVGGGGGGGGGAGGGGGGGGGGSSSSTITTTSCNECATIGQIQCITGTNSQQYKECIIFNNCNIWSAVKYSSEGKSCVNNLIVNAVPVSAMPKTTIASNSTQNTKTQTTASQTPITPPTTPAVSTTGTKTKQDAKSGFFAGSMLLYTLIAIIGVTIIALVWEWHEKRR